MLYSGAITVNNLPVLLEIAVPDQGDSIAVEYKFPVIHLKDLVEDSIKLVFTRPE